VGGAITGKRLDIGIIDDPIKNAQEALSDTVKSGVWDWYLTTFLTRLSQHSGHIIMATRWATDDLSGRILDSNPRAKLLNFPAIDDFGNALVPQLHSLEKLMEQKKTMTEHFWAAMYQQQPVALGGNLFKREWWQYYDELPVIESYSIYADTALKTATHNDYSVFQLWGRTHDKKLYLIDQVRGRMESPELLVAARAFWAKWQKYRIRGFFIEDKASGTGLIQTLRREGIPVLPIPRVTDKITRAMDAAPTIQAGLVFLPRLWDGLSDYLLEFEAFPSGKHDDQIDPTMDAIDGLRGNMANPRLRQL
jgi:predicted phage terminase large subunit-like protein